MHFTNQMPLDIKGYRKSLLRKPQLSMSKNLGCHTLYLIILLLSKLKKKMYFVVALIAMNTELDIFAWESFKLPDDHENLESL